VEVASSSLGSSLLVSHPDDTDVYVINLDPQIAELLHETKHLLQMNLDVHDAALVLCQQQARITFITDSCVAVHDCFAGVMDKAVLLRTVLGGGYD